jgi:hypothetical protein
VYFNGKYYLQIMSNDPPISSDGSFPGTLVELSDMDNFDSRLESLIEIGNTAGAFYDKTDQQGEYDESNRG